MAGKEGGGRMMDFVQSKNAGSQVARQPNAPQQKGSNEDLKLPYTKTTSTAANTAQARTVAKQDRLRDDSRNARRDSTERKAFYDTDASSIDDSSVTSSTRKRKHDVTDNLHHDGTNGHTNGIDAHGSAEENAYDGGFEGLDREHRRIFGGNALQAIGGPLSASARQTLIQREGPGALLGYVKGDSYPPTTSGNPSVAESAEANVNERRLQAPARVKAHAGQARSADVSFPAPRVQEQRQQPQAAAISDQEQSTKQGGLFVRPQSKDVHSIEELANPGFSFSKANNSRVAIRPLTKKYEQPLTERTESRAPSSTNPAHRATAPSAHNDETLSSRQDAGPKHAANHQHEAEVHRRATPKPERAVQAHGKGGRVTIDRTPNQNPSSEEEAGTEDEHSTKAIDQRETDEPDQIMLDYDHDELLSMDYHEIKAKSFDEDPNGEVVEFPEGQTTTTLDDKIDAVANLRPTDQFKFFKSLPIDEWEQAGDWFITRFGQVLDRLKTNRQDTRGAAKAHEDEVEKRHSAVSKKRKQIEDELKEMKESGGKVLQGTPKKPKMK